MKCENINLNQLVAFWNKENFIENTKIHKEDFKVLQGNLVQNCANFNEFIENYINNPEDTKFHPQLFPEPYTGDLENAKVYILSLNPGFGCDYYYEDIDEVSRMKEKTLNQDLKGEDYPFFYLNPKFCWISGAQYWLKKFDNIIEKAVKETNKSRTEILQYISQNVATLEIVPYHSKKFKFSKYKQLCSVKMMLAYINNVIIKKAEKCECIFLVLRKGNQLNIIESKSENIIVYKGGECQAASLSMKSRGGQQVYKALFGEIMSV